MFKQLMDFKFKYIIRIAFILMISGIASSSFSQSVTTQDLSNVRVDELTDAQVRQFMSQVNAMGLSQAQLEQVAQSRGMSSAEVQKLKARVEQIQPGSTGSSGANQGKKNQTQTQNRSSRTYVGQQDSIVTTEEDSLTLAGQALTLLKSKIFGADLFKNRQLSFEPNLRLATPQNYEVGPDDELLIDIYGNSEASYQLSVSPEGTINIPYVGVVSVGGMTIEQATSRIRVALSKIYSQIRTGNTNVKVVLGNIRSIKVILTGEIVKPGTYTLPSLATVFNALYFSGGPSENGSFRKIEIIRSNKRIAVLDVYDFLLSGELKGNLRLQDQDVIRIPSYISRMEVVGEVKRPGIFEVIPEESFSDLLRFTGGFTENAYKSRIKVLKNTATERKIVDITSTEFDNYKPTSGDKFFVDEILERFENRVTIEGAVFRPGQYELQSGLTVGQLIKKAEGLKEEAFRNRAYITRLKDDSQPELLSFDIGNILTGQSADIPLKREDIITVNSIFDLKEEYYIKIDGEVQLPGTFKYAEGTTLEDIIIKAGGLKESATPKRIEVSRRVKNSDALSLSAQTAEVFQVDVNQDLKTATAGFVLQPFDIVSIRSSSGYEVQKQVKIEGEVLYPGTYIITKKDERISDLLKRAGGFTALAYPEGASLKRPGPLKDASDSYNEIQKSQFQLENTGLKPGETEADRLKQIQRLQATVNISDTSNAKVNRNDYVGINLPTILKKPGDKNDIFLEEGDILNVPKQLQTVKVSGEVLSPSTVVFVKNRGFRQYVSSAGGFSEKSRKKSSYIIYANGSVNGTHRILFFNSYPLVKPGAEIFIPKKAEKAKLSLGEIVGLSTGLASLAAIVISLLR